MSAPTVLHLPREAEAVWELLVRHLDLSRGLSFILLTCADPRVLTTIRQRLDDRARERNSHVVVFEPIRLGADWRQHVIPTLLAHDDVAVDSVWLALDETPSGLERAATDTLRSDVLGTLNIGRSQIERHFDRPLVLALPDGGLRQVWAAAPDLWTVRGFVGELPPVPMSSPTLTEAG
jgi:hypothetical protein